MQQPPICRLSSKQLADGRQENTDSKQKRLARSKKSEKMEVRGEAGERDKKGWGCCQMLMVQNDGCVSCADMLLQASIANQVRRGIQRNKVHSILNAKGDI